VKRVAQVIRVRPDKLDEYRELHRDVKPLRPGANCADVVAATRDLTAALDET